MLSRQPQQVERISQLAQTDPNQAPTDETKHTDLKVGSDKTEDILAQKTQSYAEEVERLLAADLGDDPLAAVDDDEVLAQIDFYWLPSREAVFTVRSEGRTAGGGRFVREAVIVPTPADAELIPVLLGRAAGELTQSLVNIGFNPMEAAAAIRREPTTSELPLQGGGALPPALPTTRIEVRKAPDLSNVPARDTQRVTFIANEDGKGGIVEITDEIQPETREAIVLTAPPAKRDELDAEVERHLDLTAAAKAPSERGAMFRVPRLCVLEQGELELVDRGMVAADYKWDLLASPPDLASFRFNDDSMTFVVDLDGREVGYHQVKDDVATYLPGFAQDRSEADLLGWLGGGAFFVEGTGVPGLTAGLIAEPSDVEGPRRRLERVREPFELGVRERGEDGQPAQQGELDDGDLRRGVDGEDPTPPTGWAWPSPAGDLASAHRIRHPRGGRAACV